MQYAPCTKHHPQKKVIWDITKQASLHLSPPHREVSQFPVNRQTVYPDDHYGNDSNLLGILDCRSFRQFESTPVARKEQENIDMKQQEYHSVMIALETVEKYNDMLYTQDADNPVYNVVKRVVGAFEKVSDLVHASPDEGESIHGIDRTNRRKVARGPTRAIIRSLEGTDEKEDSSLPVPSETRSRSRRRGRSSQRENKRAHSRRRQTGKVIKASHRVSSSKGHSKTTRQHRTRSKVGDGESHRCLITNDDTHSSPYARPPKQGPGKGASCSRQKALANCKMLQGDLTRTRNITKDRESPIVQNSALYQRSLPMLNREQTLDEAPFPNDGMAHAKKYLQLHTNGPQLQNGLTSRQRGLDDKNGMAQPTQYYRLEVAGRPQEENDFGVAKLETLPASQHSNTEKTEERFSLAHRRWIELRSFRAGKKKEKTPLRPPPEKANLQSLRRDKAWDPTQEMRVGGKISPRPPLYSGRPRHEEKNTPKQTSSERVAGRKGRTEGEKSPSKLHSKVSKSLSTLRGSLITSTSSQLETRQLKKFPEAERMPRESSAEKVACFIEKQTKDKPRPDPSGSADLLSNEPPSHIDQRHEKNFEDTIYRSCDFVSERKRGGKSKQIICTEANVQSRFHTESLDFCHEWKEMIQTKLARLEKSLSATKIQDDLSWREEDPMRESPFNSASGSLESTSTLKRSHNYAQKSRKNASELKECRPKIPYPNADYQLKKAESIEKIYKQSKATTGYIEGRSDDLSARAVCASLNENGEDLREGPDNFDLGTPPKVILTKWGKQTI